MLEEPERYSGVILLINCGKSSFTEAQEKTFIHDSMVVF